MAEKKSGQNPRKIIRKAVSRGFDPARQQLESQKAEVTRSQALLDAQRQRLQSQEFVRGSSPLQRQSLAQQIQGSRTQLASASSQLDAASQELKKAELDAFKEAQKSFAKSVEFSITQAEDVVGQSFSSEKRQEIIDRIIANIQLDIPGVEVGQDIPMTSLVTSRVTEPRFTPLTQDVEGEGTSRSEFQVRDEQGNVFDINQEGKLINQIQPTTFRQDVSRITGGRIDVPESREEVRQRFRRAGLGFGSAIASIPSQTISGARGLFGQIPGEIRTTSLIPLARRETISPQTVFFKPVETAFTGRDVGTIIGGATAVGQFAIPGLGFAILTTGSGQAFSQGQIGTGVIAGGLAIAPSFLGAARVLAEPLAGALAKGLTIAEREAQLFIRNKRGLVRTVGQTAEGRIVLINGRKFLVDFNGNVIREITPGAGVREIDIIANQFDDLARSDVGTLRRNVLEEALKNRIKRNLDNLRGDNLRINNLREQFRRQFGADGERLFNRALSELETFQVTGVVKPTRPLITRPSQQAVISPRLGDVFDRPGAFAGTGQFERTQATIPRTPLGQQLNLRTNLVSRNQLTQRSIIGFRQPQLERFGQSQFSLQPQLQRDTTLQRVAQEQASQQRALQRARLGLGLGLASAQQSAQLQRARLRLRIPTPQIPRQPGIPRQPTPRITTPPIVLPEQAARIKKNLNILRRQAKVFDVFVKRKQKWEKIANDLPFRRALKKGADVTRDTLAAQFKVVPDKKGKTKLKDIKFSPSPQVFRDFKIKGGVAQALPLGHFIERRNKRISSGGEIGEVLRAQRRGKEKRKRRVKLL